MTKRVLKLVCKVLGLRVPTKYLPGRNVTFTDADVAALRAAYGQSTDGQW